MPAAAIQTDVVIVGAGPVGLFQAFQLGLLGVSSQIVDVLPEPGGQCHALYAGKPLYDIPAVPAVEATELVQRLLQQLRPFTHPEGNPAVPQSVQLHLGQQVTELHLLEGAAPAPTGAPSNGSTGAPSNAPTPLYRFELVTHQAQRFRCKALVLAAGVGAFVPRKPVLDGLARWEGTQVFYHPPALDGVSGSVVIQGDSDQALLTAIEWASPSGNPNRTVTLLHRREVFDAEPATLAAFNALRQSKAITFVAGQALALIPDRITGRLQALQVATPDGATVQLPLDLYLPLLGLSPKLSPLADWGLALDKKQVPVDPATCQTQVQGLYAVGDVNHYPGKRKLIVSGFHDATIAAYAIAERLHGHSMPVQYTTANKQMHARLGVAP